MERVKFPGLIEWGLLVASTAVLAGICHPLDAHSTPENQEIVLEEKPPYQPLYGPYPLAQRIHCHDIGAYSDHRLNFSCGQEKHQ